MNNLDKNIQHIPRDSRLISLTGNSPFNAEPTLDLLYDNGFITPTSIAYVRNHGEVPLLEWDNHKLEIYSIKNVLRSFKMDELFGLCKIYTLAVTFACDGNRRKELNMIKNTGAFDWGPAAISNCYYSGIKLCNLLNMLFDPISPEDFHKLHVHFEGADNLTNGAYATSIPYLEAINPSNDILIAYKQNGEHLTRDHGFPLRLIIPGYVGGKNIKWLKNIKIKDYESTNWYHLHDNRKLPSKVKSLEQADKEKWWYNPDTLLTEQILQSVISYPKHNQSINLLEQNVIEVKGIAYNGGGRKITKIELSINDGLSWDLCKKHYPNFENNSQVNNTNYKVWTWCFWEIQIDASCLLDKTQIMVKAWDSSMNTQPADRDWCLKGYMNNSIYKVKFEKTDNELVFKHPVKAGAEAQDGWMEIEKQETTKEKESFKPLSEEDVEELSKKEECIVIINNKVYDLTEFMDIHPGGSSILKKYSGKDASKMFNSIHNETILKQADQFARGSLQPKL